MLAGFDDVAADVSGGPVRHVPVLLSEVIDALDPKKGKTIFDGTFGAGGYSRAMMEKDANVVATDQDPDVIANSDAIRAEFADQLSLHHAKFSQILDIVDEGSLDGFVLDIGVSSMQIDQAERGFSFMQDGPLDMRMAQNGVSAADVVNTLKSNELARIFGFYGEEKKAGRIARAIEQARLEEPITTTGQLAKIVSNAAPRKMTDRIHPATRVFQALRIYINDELGQLALALLAAEKALKPGGRLVVVTFHSLEDRIVKKFFTDRFGRVSGSRHLPQVEVPDASFEQLGKKPMIAASKREAEENPRARSAKLRAGIRTDAPAGSSDMKIFGLPNLYPLKKVAGLV
ncbi:MAG: 16S rRNA (cytosine(1402)-N(4))-methyltransferase RsmH [Rhizobiaceae bacterium]|nr:16S rRNA (cytosine(1402)-N(4))-methyltransferase RsmH [Rhizobiaceae bacterium]